MAALSNNQHLKKQNFVVQTDNSTEEKHQKDEKSAENS